MAEEHIVESKGEERRTGSCHRPSPTMRPAPAGMPRSAAFTGLTMRL